MTDFNLTNIIEKWPEMTPQMRLQYKHIYREAMSRVDLVSQWDKMTNVQRMHLLDLYKAQRKEKYKIHKKRVLTVSEDKESIKMDNFNQRFVLNVLQRCAPKGYQFVIVGDDRRIAIQSTEIMGNQTPRGAFISDISFDMIEGVYGSLFKNDKEAFNSDIIYWRMRSFQPEKPHRTTKEKHEQYVKTIESIASKSIPCLDMIQKKPFAPTFRKNAIIVQGFMDSGIPAPKYLNDKLHETVNNIVWWSFNRAMHRIKASKLVKYRNTYKKNMGRINAVPGTRSGFTMWRDNIDLHERINLRTRMEELQYDILPQALEAKDAKKTAQTQQEILKLQQILGADYTEIVKPARSLLRNTFYVNQTVKQNGVKSKQTVERKFPKNMSVLKQFWLLINAREQKKQTKTK